MSLSTLPPMRVPTLTEVVDWSPGFLVDVPPPHRVDADAEGHADVVPPDTAAADAPPAAERRSSPRIDEAVLTQRILADLQRQVDLMLDHHLRVAMEPALNRLAEALAHSARDELASALRDMVARAVSQELVRHRVVSDRNDSG